MSNDRTKVYFVHGGGGIATLHHYGTPTLPERQLLSITSVDQRMIKDIIVKALA